MRPPTILENNYSNWIVYFVGTHLRNMKVADVTVINYYAFQPTSRRGELKLIEVASPYNLFLLPNYFRLLSQPNPRKRKYLVY